MRRTAALASAAIFTVCAAVSLPSFADMTIANNLTLTADADWRADGVVTVAEGATVDLNGHTLWVSGLAGAGTFTSAVDDPATFDLTTKQTDASRVKSYSGGTDQALGTEFAFSIEPAWKLFADYESYSYGTQGHRAITAFDGTPVDIVYTFDSATVINAYKIQANNGSTTYNQRAPHEWKFYGSQTGEDDSWVELDSHADVSWTQYEQKTFTFPNTTAYTHYRLRVIAVGTNGNLEMFSLEYGRIHNQVRICPSPSASFAAASNTVSGTAKFVVADGALSANADLRGLGKVSLGSGELLDLAGHYLRVHSIDGAAKVMTSDTSTFTDLTSPERARSYATATTNGVVLVMAGSNKYPASAAFDDSLDTSTSGNVLNPCHFAYYDHDFRTLGVDVCVNYDFGEPTRINRYRICGTCYESHSSVPKSWAFEGSSDGGGTWTTLDVRSNETLPFAEYAEYTFFNEAAYSRYRLRVTAATEKKLYLYELEYGTVPYNAIYVDPAGIASSDFSDIILSGVVRFAIAKGDALVLSADLDLSGFAIDGTIDLQGNTLTVDRLEGNGTITDTTSMLDLTDSDESRVWSPNTYYETNAGTAKDAFSNQISPSRTGVRVMAPKSQLPVVIDYDFRAATVVDMYRLTSGDNKDRSPGAWEIFGSNDDAAYKSGVDELSAWKRLDTRFGETWSANYETHTYGFGNSTAYRYYRIRFTASALVGKDYLTFWKLQYGCSANCGQLRVNVPSGNAYNRTVSITGNVRLVKDGEGTFIPVKAPQSYSGGTDVAQGRLTLSVNGSELPFGAKWSDIVVRQGAVLDLNGQPAEYHFYGITLDGGILRHTGSDQSSGSMLNRVRLTADSMLDLVSNYGFYGESNTSPTFLDLGGHTLQIQIAATKYCRFYCTTIIDGTVDVTSGGWFLTGGSYVTATNVDFKMNCALYMAQQFNVRGYEANFYSTGSNSGTAQMTVTGTFRPTVLSYYGCTMLAGSTMDLTAWPGSWPMTSAFGENGKTDLEFANSGEIAVNLAGRTDLKALARSADPHLFTWTVVEGNPVIPGAEFVLDPATAAAGYKLQKDTTGLKLVRPGFVIFVQ